MATEQHPHGTWQRYYSGCHCPPCNRARRHRDYERARAVANGDPLDLAQVDAQVMHLHIKVLLAAVPHATARDIFALAHLIDSRVAPTYLHGRGAVRDRVRRCTERAVRSITPEMLAAHTKYVPSGPTLRRLDMLAALGYPQRWIAAHTEGRPAITMLAQYRPDVVLRTVADAIEALYRRIGERAADPERDRISRNSIVRAVNYARRRGLYPPFAYDDVGNLLDDVVRSEVPDDDDEREWLDRWRALDEVLRGRSDREASEAVGRSPVFAGNALRRLALKWRIGVGERRLGLVDPAERRIIDRIAGDVRTMRADPQEAWARLLVELKAHRVERQVTAEHAAAGDANRTAA